MVALICGSVMATARVGLGQAAAPRTGIADDLKPRLETLLTADGVPLRCHYFPSDKGKNAIPVILIHEWKGQASPYVPLAMALQKAGCAVVLPDLRGHGASRTYLARGGEEREFDLSRMGRADVAAILLRDLETVKRFLKEQNNAGALNLNALTLVGVREGCVLAINWAITDWNFPNIGAHKQGKDVKALVLVSPVKLLHGYTVDAMFRDAFVWRLPTLIVVGQNSPEAEEADRLYRRLEVQRKRTQLGAADVLKREQVDTSLSGASLITRGPGAASAILSFVGEQMVANADRIPWVARD